MFLPANYFICGFTAPAVSEMTVGTPEAGYLTVTSSQKSQENDHSTFGIL